MNTADAELLSAYLDGVLTPAEADDLAARLAVEPELQKELFAMRQVVGSLRALPQVAPPPTLELALVRRLALVGDRPGLAGRIERRFLRITEQPVLLMTLALVLAFTAILAVFGGGVTNPESARIPVRLNPPDLVAPPVVDAVRHTGHGIFHLVDGVWIAAKVVGPPDRLASPDDPLVVPLLGDVDFAKLVAQGPVRLRIGGEIVEIR